MMAAKAKTIKTAAPKKEPAMAAVEFEPEVLGLSVLVGNALSEVILGVGVNSTVVGRVMVIIDTFGEINDDGSVVDL